MMNDDDGGNVETVVMIMKITIMKIMIMIMMMMMKGNQSYHKAIYLREPTLKIGG